jgi:hypothetical protein
MSMIQEYLEWKKTYDPTPPKASKTYNRFFWWRRYQEHKFLPNRSPIWDKAKNGDYDVSPYWKQREWEYWFEEQELIKFRKEYKGSYQNKGWEERGVTKLFWERRKRLLKDAEKDEHNRWALFIKDVKESFGGTEEGIKEMFESFEGTMIEFLTAYRDSRNLPKIQPPPKF